MFYCEGKDCSRRDQCAYHEAFDWKWPRQHLDKSLEGHGFSSVDENGNNINGFYINCGDNGDYIHYMALGYRENQEYRNSIGLKYDEICINCEHRSLCFLLLEYAGLITREAKRIMCHMCESIKKDPQYHTNKLKEKFGKSLNDL